MKFGRAALIGLVVAGGAAVPVGVLLWRGHSADGQRAAGTEAADASAGENLAPGRDGVYRRTRFVMDTYVTIRVNASKEVAERATSRAFERIEAVNVRFNRLDPKSPVYAFNNQGTPITDPELLEAARAALETSRLSGGAFDVTVAPLIDLWGFPTKQPHLPAKQDVEEALRRVGYQQLLLSGDRLEKSSPQVAIDLGGVGKGYAIREAVKVLRSEGVSSALVDAGGDVYALGNLNGRPWKVGLRDPRGEGLLGYVEVEDLAVIGSGDYERFFMEGGERYHHIFDARTGYPARGLSAVFVIVPESRLIQGLGAALFALGPEQGLKLAERTPDLQVVMVTTSGEVLSTSDLGKALTRVKAKGKE